MQECYSEGLGVTIKTEKYTVWVSLRQPGFQKWQKLGSVY